MAPRTVPSVWMEDGRPSTTFACTTLPSGFAAFMSIPSHNRAVTKLTADAVADQYQLALVKQPPGL